VSNATKHLFTVFLCFVFADHAMMKAFKRISNEKKHSKNWTETAEKVWPDASCLTQEQSPGFDKQIIFYFFIVFFYKIL
jgi:hypothetical protein